MLVLTVKVGEPLRLRDTRNGEATWVMVMGTTPGKAKLAINAPAHVEILRGDLLAREGATRTMRRRPRTASDYRYQRPASVCD
jgi:sRNA-binding carbon storage regulator CsrA